MKVKEFDNFFKVTLDETIQRQRRELQPVTPEPEAVMRVVLNWTTCPKEQHASYIDALAANFCGDSTKVKTMFPDDNMPIEWK